MALHIKHDQVDAIVPENQIAPGSQDILLDGGTLLPGFVDLQINGGDGLLLNDAPTLDTVKRIARAHARLGVTALLPTLITDTADQVSAAIDAVEHAIAENMPGVVGLHLEGPHLSVARKGAHDPELIRPMTESDLRGLVEGAARLPTLMVTLAPESVSSEQISTLSKAGVIVSLGHTDIPFDQAMQAAGDGARVVTHLFNAMSQLQNRDPGLVGGALAHPELSAGLIADGIHVHPAAMAAAIKAKTGPGEIFLVSDAMAAAGSDLTEFTLNGRKIKRQDHRLTLADGTLAGADLDLARAIQVLVNEVGCAPQTAFAMATAAPARAIGRFPELGSLQPKSKANIVHLSDEFELTAVWHNGLAQAI